MTSHTAPSKERPYTSLKAVHREVDAALVAADAPRVPWWMSTRLILVLAAVLRAIVLLVYEGESQDGVTRVAIAERWWFGGHPIFGRTAWPEGNYVLPAMALAVWRDAYWSPRILFALIALTNVWLAIRLGRAAFDRRSGAIAGWIVALMPFHLVMSGDHATSEVPYVSLLVGALLAVIAWRERPRLWLAVVAGLLLTASVTFRFDGVMWGIPLGLSFALFRARGRWLQLDRETIGHALAFGVTGLVYPVALFAQWSHVYGNAWHHLDENRAMAAQFFGSGGHQRWPAWLYQTYAVGFWPASMFLLLTPVLALLGWYGVVSVLRGDARRPVPLLLGLGMIGAWLAYATYTHAILAQWRYALVLAVVLCAFVGPGWDALRAAFPRIPAFAIGVAVLFGAAVCQIVIIDASLHDRGTLTRQLTLLSPIRPDQFAARGFLRWSAANATRAAPVVLTPHAEDSPYFALHREGPESEGRIIVQSYMTPTPGIVHSRASLTSELRAKLSTAGWLVTNLGPRELGLRDALVREIVQPTGTNLVKEWQGVRLQHVRDWGSLRLWKVMH